MRAGKLFGAVQTQGPAPGRTLCLRGPYRSTSTLRVVGGTDTALEGRLPVGSAKPVHPPAIPIRLFGRQIHPGITRFFNAASLSCR